MVHANVHRKVGICNTLALPLVTTSWEHDCPNPAILTESFPELGDMFPPPTLCGHATMSSLFHLLHAGWTCTTMHTVIVRITALQKNNSMSARRFGLKQKKYPLWLGGAYNTLTN